MTGLKRLPRCARLPLFGTALLLWSGGGILAAPPVLIVKPLRDASGTLPKGAGEAPLNVRYAQALRGRIRDVAKNSLRVLGADADDRAAVHFTVEGDLSRADTTSLTAGAYLCVLRLYREGKPRRLILQMAGTADTLRDLTGNLKQNPAFDLNGLAGEFAARIAAATRPETEASEFLAAADKAAESRRLTVAMVTEDAAGKPTDAPGMDIKKGATFRLRVTSQDAGAVYLVALTDGGPKPVFAPADALDIRPNVPVLLPPGAPLTPPAADSAEYIALVRISAKAADAKGNGPAAPTDAARGDARDREKESSAPAQVLLSGERAPGDLDEGVKRLLALLRGDASGTWTAIRVRVNFR